MSNKTPGSLAINIDAAQMGVGGEDSWSRNAKPYPEYRLESGRTYTLAFTVKTGGEKKGRKE